MEKQNSGDQLLQRWRDGDELAAEELYARYAQRLYDLASRQMGSQLLRRIAPDDIVQSVFRTFFRRADQWRFQTDRGGAIWHLLVRITLNKIRSKGVYYSAQCRNVGAEVELQDDEFEVALVAHEPTPVEAAALCEELEAIHERLDDVGVRTLDLAIQGYSATEIATQIGRSRWTVRRILDRIGHNLQRRIEDDQQE